MIAYEFYWGDEEEGIHLIGILPERRKNPERVNQESIMKWGRKILGNSTDISDFYFVQVEF